ncbi:MAG: type II secretion system major pseudopilin GspG [Myxococcota bacterium]
MKREEKIFNNVARGMTLVEIMVVVMILGLIASAVGVAVLKQLDKAKIQTTCQQMKDLENALDLYKLENGDYPGADKGIEALVTEEILKGSALPKDAWGIDFVYIYPGQHNPGSFDLYSRGPDKRESDDDLTNWGPPCVR